MVDECTITRAGVGAPVFDPATGTYTDPAPTTQYQGKCRVKPRDLVDRVVQAGDQPTSIWPYLVSIPFGAADVTVDDVITITASADPTLVDRELRVRSATRGTNITARRLGCEEVESP